MLTELIIDKQTGIGMATLTLTDAAGRQRVYELSQTVTLAGRASTNAIQINDEKSSRQHFKVERHDDGQFYVEDSGSTNGTRVNGTKIAEPTVLKSGDTIQVGKCIYAFLDSDAPPPAPAAVEELSPQEAAAAMAEQINSTAPTMPPKNMREEIEAERLAAAAKKENKPKYVIKVLEGAGAGKVVEIGNEPLTIGRHASNTIQIDDEAASNYHSEVSHENIGFVVTDLGSTNGTRVKPKEKNEFEKIVKTPLSPGMQILIGKTLLEFQNIGAPAAEEDHVFKTMELDPEKLNQRLAQLQAAGGGNAAAIAGVMGGPAQTGMGTGAKVVIGLGVAAAIAAGAIFIPPMLKKSGPTIAEGDPKDPKDPKNPKVGKQPKSVANLLLNAGFDEGTDDDGYPIEFRVAKAGDVQIKITPDAAHEGGGDAAKRGLQISKGGSRSSAKPSVVDSRDPIPIDSNKVYEVLGWARNTEDGIYGLRVTWVRGDHDLADDVAFKDEQGWKELKSPALTPPSWATHARVGVFAQGKSGKACFDDLVFREKVGAQPQHTPPVRFSGIDVQFEGSKGLFTISSQGKTVAEDCTLRLETAESKSASDLVSALKPSMTKEEGVNYEGKIYDFSLVDVVPYGIGAKPGAAGVDLHAEVTVPQNDSTSKPLLRMFLVSPAAAGEIDIVKGDKSAEHLLATDDKVVAGVKSVLFNTGKTPQLNMVFEKPVELNLKREGKRRLVEVRFDKEVQVSMSPEDVEQRTKMQAAVAELKKALNARDWGGAEAKAKALTEQFANFQQAQDEVKVAKEALDAAFKSAMAELQKIDDSLKAAYNNELRDNARATIQRHADAWKGSDEKLAAMAAPKASIEATIAKNAENAAEGQAQEALKMAKNYYDKKIFNVALSFIDKILNDPVMSKTKAGDDARQLRSDIEKGSRRAEDLRGITTKLKDLADPLFKQGKINEGIRVIETDPEYKANKADLTEINDYIEEWRKKK